jgi:hypothetical protein
MMPPSAPLDAGCVLFAGRVSIHKLVNGVDSGVLQASNGVNQTGTRP